MAIVGAIERGGLVGIGAVPEVFHFGVSAPEDFEGVGEIAERLGAVHFLEVLHSGISDVVVGLEKDGGSIMTDDRPDH